MIKYKFAKDENEKLIDIDSLNVGNRVISQFYCIGCGNELIARLGKIKVHHFAHKMVVSCSGETYLHLLGKQLFFENYSECLKSKRSFTIEIYQNRTCNHFENELSVKCKLPTVTTKFDLTHYFDKISIETRESSFIPDIMLTSKNGQDKIFIEIAVTHHSTAEKLNSNYRIIELDVENEDDFEPIKRKYLSITNSNIKFKNFKSNEIITSICDGNCKIDYNFFTVDTEGRCILKQRNLRQIKNQLAKEMGGIVKYEISKNNGRNYSDIFKKGVATFSKQNIMVKNCFVCRYHAENNSWQYFEDTTGVPIFCKFLKIKCNSNQAVSCGYFKLEKKHVQKILTIIQEYDSENEQYYNELNERETDDGICDG